MTGSNIGSLMRILCGLLFLAALPVWAQPCEISDQVTAALEAARKSGGPAMDALKAVRNQFPQDYFAHRAYQDASMSRGVFSDYVQGEYRGISGMHPDDPLYLTLYARALTGTRTKDALATLESVLALRPDYAYAHLKMAEIYNSTVFHDDAKLRAHLIAYRKSCPQSTLGYTLAARVEDAEFVKQSAAGLRAVLEKSSKTASLTAYSTLWTMEFKTVPLAAQGPLRERVGKDLARLRALDSEKDHALAATMLQGYKTMGDTEGIKWAESRVPPNPNGGNPVGEAISKWRQANQSKMMASFQDFQSLLAKQADEWIKQWPDEPQPRAEKFQALRSDRDAPQEEVVKAAEEWIRVYEAHPGGTSNSPYNSVAQFYSSKNMRYDELPGLLEKALKDIKEPVQVSLSDLVPANSMPALMAHMSKWSTWNSAASTYIKIKQYDKARELLDKLGPSLQEFKLSDNPSTMEKQQYGIQEMQYWDSKSNLARAEGRKLDALVFQKNAYLTNAFPTPAGMQDFRVNSVKNLWKELGGGSDEGFEAFLHPAGGTSKPEAPKQTAVAATTAGRWTSMETPLPDFQFPDASGKVWKLADLKGKVTLINMWATWCGPCRAELPYLQKLYDKVRDRKDLQVITFNTDDSQGLILPFVAENKYTFPVMPALDYVHKLVPQLSIPRNWIVDASGVLRNESVGFGNGDDKWVEDMIVTMEKARHD